jgi:ribosomal protein S12 methylthiotransferase
MMREAEKLAAAGVKELLVISQDTSAYGVDVKYASSMWKDRNGNEREIRAKFLDLSQALGELGVWVRMHYVYPYPHVADVIPLMAEGDPPYLDIPFQHASPEVLKNMRRPAHGEKTLERIRSWRDACPTLLSVQPSSSAFPAKRTQISRCCSTGLTKPKSTAPVVSNTNR